MPPEYTIAAVGLFIVLVTNIVIVARWTGKIGALVKQHDQEIDGIKKLLSRHDERLFDLEVKAEVTKQLQDYTEAEDE